MKKKNEKFPLPLSLFCCTHNEIYQNFICQNSMKEKLLGRIKIYYMYTRLTLLAAAISPRRSAAISATFKSFSLASTPR